MSSNKLTEVSINKLQSVRTSVVLHENTPERPSSGREQINPEFTKKRPYQLCEQRSAPLKVRLKRSQASQALQQKSPPIEKKPLPPHTQLPSSPTDPYVDVLSQINNLTLKRPQKSKVSLSQDDNNNEQVNTTPHFKPMYCERELTIITKPPADSYKSNTMEKEPKPIHQIHNSNGSIQNSRNGGGVISTMDSRLDTSGTTEAATLTRNSGSTLQAESNRNALFGPNVSPQWDSYCHVPGVTDIPFGCPEWKLSLLQKKNCQIVHNHLRTEEDRRRQRELVRIEAERQLCVPEWMRTLLDEKRVRRQQQDFEKMLREGGVISPNGTPNRSWQEELLESRAQRYNKSREQTEWQRQLAFTDQS